MSDLRFYVSLCILVCIFLGLFIYKKNHPATYGECYTKMEHASVAVFGCCGGDPNKLNKCKDCPYYVNLDDIRKGEIDGGTSKKDR